MKNTISSKLIITILLLTLGIFSCTKESMDLNNLNETIFVRHKNADMPAHIHGNGSEKVFLIILHGGPGGTSLGYRANTFITHIEKNNAVVYFDQRGSGSAQGQYSEKDLSIDLMAEDVLALAKVIKAKYGNDSRLFLLGHSWGGTLGPAVLLKNQNEFLGWIDVNGGHNMAGLYDEYRVILPKSANEQIALGNSVDFWQNTLDVVKNIDPNYSVDNVLKLNSIAIKVDEVLSRDKVINEEPIHYLGDKPVRTNGLIKLWNMRKLGKILDYKKGLNQITFTNQLPKITIPSLVLWGKYDHVIPLVFAHEAFDNLGSSDKELFIFEKSGHSPILREPNLFADKVIEFINKHK